ncbi:MAG TPA: hypothetical protein ENK96_00260 [Desulfobulbaceae bacterium]|nr:hypothetical protein [Desulfobulbaceae bacterium]
MRFAQRVKEETPEPLHAMYVVGSVLTPDYNPACSDINSVIVVKEKEPPFLDFLIGLGKIFREKKVAPPLVMTADYIQRSLDVFPIEFLNFREIHHTLYGEDYLKELLIDDQFLRLQCEREIKAKLLWLGQVYLEALGDQRELSQKLTGSVTGYLPLFRAILRLAGHEIPLACNEVTAGLQQVLDFDSEIFLRLYRMKTTDRQLTDKDELCSCFSRYYQATEKIADYVDALSY